MKYDCSDEFDLNSIYMKLTSNSCAPMVKAKDFFTQKSDLTLLQEKVEKALTEWKMRKRHTAKR